MPPTSRLGHLSAQLQPSGAAAGATSGDYPVARHPDGSAVAPSVLPGRTPLDIRLGLTQPEGVAHPLRWGILGAAKICEDWARALRDVPGAETVAVAARSQDSAQAFADKMGLPKAYEGYEALAADPDIDIVYIGTITALHKEHALMCIAAGTPTPPQHSHSSTFSPPCPAGKHVLVEKPLSLSKADSQEMYDAAAAAGVMCQEGMWSRYFPAAEHARHLIESGAIGEVRMLQADMGGLMMNQDPEDMVTKREFHNSMLSCYAVQSIGLAYPGVKPTKISAAGHKPDGFAPPPPPLPSILLLAFAAARSRGVRVRGAGTASSRRLVPRSSSRPSAARPRSSPSPWKRRWAGSR